MRAAPRGAIIAGAWTLGALLAGSASIIAGAGLSPKMSLALGDALTYHLPMLLAVVATAIVAKRTLGSGLEHRFWGLLSIASTLLFASEVYWTWYAVSVDPHGPPTNSPTRLFHLVAAMIILVLMAQMTKLDVIDGASRARTYLDLLAAMVIAWPVVYKAWTLPAFSNFGEGAVEAAVYAAFYPVMGVAMLVGIAVVFLKWRAYSWFAWERLIAVAVAIYAVGLASYPAWYPSFLVQEEHGFTWFSPILGFGYFLLFVAALYRVLGGEEVVLRDPWPAVNLMPAWARQAYPLLLSVALPILGAVAFSGRHAASSAPVLWSALALGVLLVARSWVVSVQRFGATHGEDRPKVDPFDHRRLERELGEILEAGFHAGISVCLLLFDVRGAAPPDEDNARGQIDSDIAVVRSMLNQEVPSGSVIHRYGSDELAVVCTGLDAAGSRELARRVRGRVSHAMGVRPGGTPSVVVGIAPADSVPMGPNALLARAEAALTVARGSEVEPIAVFENSMAALTPGQRVEFARSRALRESVRALAQAVDARNSATANHSTSVSELATALAQVLGLDDTQVQLIGLAALVHDVGKVGAPDTVFAITEPVHAEDIAAVQAHPVLGERILSAAHLDQVLPIVRHHHERWDGTGYPDGLSGHEIPLGARVLAVCDTFEAATAGRPGSMALDTRAALEFIRSQAGSCFDPVIAGAFGRMIDRLSAPIAGGSILD